LCPVSTHSDLPPNSLVEFSSYCWCEISYNRLKATSRTTVGNAPRIIAKHSFPELLAGIWVVRREQEGQAPLSRGVKPLAQVRQLCAQFGGSCIRSNHIDRAYLIDAARD
jgi:hypothetical protein